MSLSFFPLFASSIWWNFSEYEIGDKIRNSFDMPLFMLCYSHYCPHCHGLPEGFSEYNKTLGNRNDIYLSMLDCALQSGCGYFRIRGTPQMILVLGNKHRYWPVSPERGPNGWDRWINERIGPNLRQIYNDSELDEAKQEPKEGGSTFFLETPSENHKWVNMIRNLSKMYRIFNDTFVFKVNPSISKPILHAFPSEFCDYVYHGTQFGIKGFLEKHKFGVFHRYDRDEFKELTKASIYIVEKDLSPGQRESLRLLPKGRCGDMVFGWSNTKDEDKQIYKLTSSKDAELPFLYSIGFTGSADRKYKKRLNDIGKSGFLSSSFKKVLIESLSCPQYFIFFAFSIFLIIFIVVFVYMQYRRHKNQVMKKPE